MPRNVAWLAETAAWGTAGGNCAFWPHATDARMQACRTPQQARQTRARAFTCHHEVRHSPQKHKRA
eukprot:6605623-Lingulodinium_polyedra.AAC.1